MHIINEFLLYNVGQLLGAATPSHVFNFPPRLHVFYSVFFLRANFKRRKSSWMGGKWKSLSLTGT